MCPLHVLTVAIAIGTPIVASYTRTTVGQLHSVGACVDTGGADASVAVCDYEPSSERTDARQPHEHRIRTSCSPENRKLRLRLPIPPPPVIAAVQAYVGSV